MQNNPARRIFAGSTLWLVLLTLLNLFNYLDRYVLPGVQTMVKTEFRLTDAETGLLTTAFFVAYMIVAPLTGWLGDRYSRRPLIALGALLWSLATLLTAWVTDYRTLLFRHAVVGIGEATFVIFAPALLSDLFPERTRNRALSIFYLAIPVGSALGYVTGGEIGSRYGWRAPFLVSAIPGLALALLILMAKEPERGQADTLPQSMERASLGGLLRNRGFWTATLGMAFFTFTIGGISVWMPTFMERQGGFSMADANRLLGVITVLTGIMGTWIGGWWAQRLLARNHRAMYLVSAWSALLFLPFAALALFGPSRYLVGALTAAEFFLFLNTGPLNTALINSVSASVRSVAISINLLMIHLLGDALSPTVIGDISDHFSLRMGMGSVMVAMVLCAGILQYGARFAPVLGSVEG